MTKRRLSPQEREIGWVVFVVALVFCLAIIGAALWSALSS